MLGRYLQRLWSGRKDDAQTVLTQAQACAIANQAVIGTPHANLMGMVRAEQRDGRWVWTVGSTTIGSGLSLTIDDATGAVTQRESWGVR